jgi:hypothetical protein
MAAGGNCRLLSILKRLGLAALPRCPDNQVATNPLTNPLS